MVVEPGQRAGSSRQRGRQLVQRALEAFAVEGARLADGATLAETLAAIAEATAAATAADLAVARILTEGDELVARAVATASPALVAEIEGTRFPAAELPADDVDTLELLPSAVARIAGRASATAVLQIPARLGGRLVGSLELMRRAGAFDASERVLARLAAAEVALAVAAFGEDDAGVRAAIAPEDALELAGEALAASSDGARTADLVARLASEATGARACLLWRGGLDGQEPVLLGAFAHGAAAGELAETSEAAAPSLHAQERVTVEPGPGADEVTATLLLGLPTLGALQLVFDRDRPPGDAELGALAGFGVRAAEALRSGERTRALGLELERTRALLAVVGQAIARLSLAHTLETALEQVARLLDAERIAVYLHERGRLVSAAEHNLAGPHAEVAARLLELALGAFRARGILIVADAVRDPRLSRVRGAVAEAGIEAAHAVPLLAHEDVIGLLAVYPRRGRSLSESESELLAALAGQLAVAVQNARLHEQAKQLGAELEHALTSERVAARRLRALYEISHSFAHSLSLEKTLDAVAQTVVELLDVDAAVVRMPDERGESLVAQAIYVADARMDEAIRAIFARPQPSRFLVRRLLRRGEPFTLDVQTAVALGGSHELLVPFLEKGSTAVVVPIATPSEVLATLTLLSLDPARPITSETSETALSIAGQAALAIDNARLYQQQKQFADTMQRSLLPRHRPDVAGLEVGEAYESSARLDVGGDLYDYLALDDGSLAVVLGDVTGHGIDAAADMAMAKFVFRSLAREYPRPDDFLAHANDVVCGEVALGKFVTMLYLTIDPHRGEVACACAGHPPPRLLLADGTVETFTATGLALGIEAGQSYEAVRRELEPGSAVVLYTDGVVEARRGRELYGEERLDRFLAERHGLAAGDLAPAILADCRRFSGGDLSDDCAVVVITRASA